MTDLTIDPHEDAMRRLLVESQLDPDDDLLLDAVLDLRTLGTGASIMPSLEVAALMQGGRRPKRGLGTRGAVVVALIATACLGTGLSAAASPQVRDGAQHAIAAIVHVVAPGAPVARIDTTTAEVDQPKAIASDPVASPAPTRSRSGGTAVAPALVVPGTPRADDSATAGSAASTTAGGHHSATHVKGSGKSRNADGAGNGEGSANSGSSTSHDGAEDDSEGRSRADTDGSLVPVVSDGEGDGSGSGSSGSNDEASQGD